MKRILNKTILLSILIVMAAPVSSRAEVLAPPIDAAKAKVYDLMRIIKGSWLDTTLLVWVLKEQMDDVHEQCPGISYDKS